LDSFGFGFGFVFTPTLPSSTTVVVVVAAGRALGCCLAYGGLSSFFHSFFFVSADWQMNRRSLRDFWLLSSLWLKAIFVEPTPFFSGSGRSQVRT
jgi:hypothetical protein